MTLDRTNKVEISKVGDTDFEFPEEAKKLLGAEANTGQDYRPAHAGIFSAPTQGLKIGAGSHPRPDHAPN